MDLKLHYQDERIDGVQIYFDIRSTVIKAKKIKAEFIRTSGSISTFLPADISNAYIFMMAVTA